MSPYTITIGTPAKANAYLDTLPNATLLLANACSSFRQEETIEESVVMREILLKNFKKSNRLARLILLLEKDGEVCGSFHVSERVRIKVPGVKKVFEASVVTTVPGGGAMLFKEYRRRFPKMPLIAFVDPFCTPSVNLAYKYCNYVANNLICNVLSIKKLKGSSMALQLNCTDLSFKDYPYRKPSAKALCALLKMNTSMGFALLGLSKQFRSLFKPEFWRYTPPQDISEPELRTMLTTHFKGL